MKIEIQIPGISQIAEAIIQLANAIKSHGQITASPVTVSGSTTDTIQATEETTSTSEAPKEELTPSQKRKAELCEQITALGGTPPEKGSVAKFEKVLADAQAAQEGTSDEEPETTSEEVAETNVDDIEAEEAGTPKLEEVRMLAAVVVRCETDGGPNEDLGKTKLRACLKAVAAKNLTSATPEQLTKIVPLLENNAGKTLAEVVAETTA